MLSWYARLIRYFYMVIHTHATPCWANPTEQGQNVQLKPLCSAPFSNSVDKGEDEDKRRRLPRGQNRIQYMRIEIILSDYCIRSNINEDQFQTS